MTGPNIYEIQKKKWCKPCIIQGSKCIEYESYFKAKSRCNEDHNCTIVINYRGENRYRLCGVSSKIRYSSKGSVLYLKQAGKMLHHYPYILDFVISLHVVWVT